MLGLLHVCLSPMTGLDILASDIVLIGYHRSMAINGIPGKSRRMRITLKCIYVFRTTASIAKFVQAKVHRAIAAMTTEPAPGTCYLQVFGPKWVTW